MATFISQTAALSLLDTIIGQFVGGILRVRTAADANLVSFTLDASPFNTSVRSGSNAESTLKRAYTATATGTGTAAKFVLDGGGGVLFITGAIPGEGTMSNTSINTSDQVTLNSWVIRQPGILD